MSFLSIQSYATTVYLLLVFPSFNHWCLLWLLLFNHCLFKLSHAWFLFVMVLIQTSALKEREGEEFSEDLNLGIRGRSRGYELWYHWQCGGFLNCSHPREKKIHSIILSSRTNRNNTILTASFKDLYWIGFADSNSLSWRKKYALWLLGFLLLFGNITINTFSSLLISICYFIPRGKNLGSSTVLRLPKNCPFLWYRKSKEITKRKK